MFVLCYLLFVVVVVVVVVVDAAASAAVVVHKCGYALNSAFRLLHLYSNLRTALS
jgi:hypothetical protein